MITISRNRNAIGLKSEIKKKIKKNQATKISSTPQIIYTQGYIYDQHVQTAIIAYYTVNKIYYFTSCIVSHYYIFKSTHIIRLKMHNMLSQNNE